MWHVDEGTIHALLDGELSTKETHTVEAHLEQCTECRALLDEARDFQAESNTLVDSLQVPPGKSQRPLDGAIVARPRRPWWRKPQNMAWAASILLAVSAGYIGYTLREQVSAPAGESLDRVERPAVSAAQTPDAQDSAPSAGDIPAPSTEVAGPTDVVGKIDTEDLKRAGQREAADPSLQEEAQKARANEGGLDDGMANRDAVDQPGLGVAGQVDRLAQVPAADAAPAAAAPVPPAVPAENEEFRADGKEANGPADERSGEAEVITADEAVQLLGGSIKLVDGKTVVRYERKDATPVIVAGAYAEDGAARGAGAEAVLESNVVRAVYYDDQDREIALDQQRVVFEQDHAGEPALEAAPGRARAEAAPDRAQALVTISPNDTVITETEGETVIRWIDAGFVLILTGPDRDQLLKLMDRIR